MFKSKRKVWRHIIILKGILPICLDSNKRVNWDGKCPDWEAGKSCIHPWVQRSKLMTTIIPSKD